MSLDYRSYKKDGLGCRNVIVEFKPNVYFGGKVVSWLILSAEGEKATIGCISPGEYEFKTGILAETMTVLTGKAEVSVNGGDWKEYGPEEEFKIPGSAFNGSFRIRVKEEMVSYHCYYFISDKESFE